MCYCNACQPVKNINNSCTSKIICDYRRIVCSVKFDVLRDKFVFLEPNGKDSCIVVCTERNLFFVIT
jgi:hypothetical protein